MKKNSLSVYLIKNNLILPDEIIVDEAEHVVLGDGSNLYYQNSWVKKPEWITNFFNDISNIPEKLYNSNSRAVLLKTIKVESDTRVFAIVFGHGRHLLKEDVVEENFGLRVALNLTDENKIRSFKKREIGKTHKVTMEQMPRTSSFFEFGVDVDTDLVTYITSVSIDEDFIKGHINGSDIFTATVPYNVQNISDYLTNLYKYYKMDTYTKHFEWIDRITYVRNKVLISELDTLLFAHIINETNDFWMAYPDLLNWAEVKGFKIPGDPENKSDIELNDVIKSFRNDVANIDQFKQKRIKVISNVTEETIESISAYKCFVGETDYKNESYVISNGKWYKVDKNFVEKINREYSEIKVSDFKIIDYPAGMHEEEFNKKIAAESKGTIINLDRKLVNYGGGNSSIEICDLLTNDGKLIHIKKYGGSSVLSHLFNQGMVSAELINRSSEFVKKANEKIEDKQFKLKQGKKHEVVFGIISKYNEERPRLPFFSKITATKAAQEIKHNQFDVSIKRIKII